MLPSTCHEKYVPRATRNSWSGFRSPTATWEIHQGKNDGGSERLNVFKHFSRYKLINSIFSNFIWIELLIAVAVLVGANLIKNYILLHSFVSTANFFLSYIVLLNFPSERLYQLKFSFFVGRCRATVWCFVLTLLLFLLILFLRNLAVNAKKVVHWIASDCTFEGNEKHSNVHEDVCEPASSAVTTNVGSHIRMYHTTSFNHNNKRITSMQLLINR